ncbi:uncharacterized protein LOC122824458 isoform X4 [Gambusia affinis]|uniref:uncharacterized protein LOC122824458 isoform X4 n=1 Tax=Gambusia affinis TaxID=33528 RepID=UPI001CDB909A|nr:uncharacterized protein LOC122824458 isoform X4 [Gambusia affinis]
MIVVWTCLRLSEPVLVFQLRFASVHLGLIFLQGRASGSAPQIAGGRRGKRLTLFVCLGWIRQTACREKQAAELCCGQMGQRPSRPGVKHGGGSIMLRQSMMGEDDGISSDPEVLSCWFLSNFVLSAVRTGKTKKIPPAT